MKTTKQFLMICCLMVMAATSYGQQWETVLPDSVSISGGFVNEDNTIELVGCSGNDGAYFCSRHSENHSKKSPQQGQSTTETEGLVLPNLQLGSLEYQHLQCKKSLTFPWQSYSSHSRYASDSPA